MGISSCGFGDFAGFGFGGGGFEGCLGGAAFEAVAACLDGCSHGFGGGDGAGECGEGVFGGGWALGVEGGHEGILPHGFDLATRVAFTGFGESLQVEVVGVPRGGLASAQFGDVDAPDGEALLVVGEVYEPCHNAVDHGVWYLVNIICREDIEDALGVVLHILDDGFDDAIGGAAVGGGASGAAEEAIDLINPEHTGCYGFSCGVGGAPVLLGLTNEAAEEAACFEAQEREVEDIACGFGEEGFAGAGVSASKESARWLGAEVGGGVGVEVAVIGEPALEILQPADAVEAGGVVHDLQDAVFADGVGLFALDDVGRDVACLHDGEGEGVLGLSRGEAGGCGEDGGEILGEHDVGTLGDGAEHDGEGFAVGQAELDRGNELGAVDRDF